MPNMRTLMLCSTHADCESSDVGAAPACDDTEESAPARKKPRRGCKYELCAVYPFTAFVEQKRTGKTKRKLEIGTLCWCRFERRGD
jgi:hypothetical protein